MQSNSTPARSSTDSSNPKADMGAAFMVSLSQTMMIYQCPYCPRTFHSSQALGGHQNAHRRDRIMARERFVQERLAFMGKLNSLTPSPLAIPQPNPNFKQFIPPPVVARLGPAYDPGVGLFQPGLGYRPTNTLGFQPGLASPGYGPQNEPGFEMWHNPACPPGAGYNFPNGESRQGNYYYHPYQRSTETNSATKMKMADVPWETGMEASSDTAESHTNGAKDENGGDKDRNEITSKKRIVIDLTLSP